MSSHSKLTLTIIAALAIVALPSVSAAGTCTPQITQVHGAVCYEGYADTLVDPYCQLHIQGECLEPFNVPVLPTMASTSDGCNGYRILIADGDGVLKVAEPFASEILEATDLHYRLIPAIVNCGIDQMVAGSLIEDRLVKLQKQVKVGKALKWIDLDSKFVTFSCIPTIQ